MSSYFISVTLSVLYIFVIDFSKLLHFSDKKQRKFYKIILLSQVQYDLLIAEWPLNSDLC